MASKRSTPPARPVRTVRPRGRPELPTSVEHGLVTSSVPMQDFLRLAKKVAASEASVLVRGESGTGKELVARLLHERSRRASGPFLAVNCATLTPELLASELFGHVRGAFTGAVKNHKGLFERADGGSIFLDEVAEIPLALQARLLRVLQERSFVPVGGTRAVTVDVRVLSATHRSLRQAVAQGRFREDLMYRIRVVPLFLPPLRERPGDVEVLAWRFIDELGLRPIDGFAPRALQALVAYPWPGNVRELRNCIEYALTVGEDDVIGLDDLLPELRGEGPPDTLSDSDRDRLQLLEALDAVEGHRGEAAERLGISRSTLWRRLKLYGMG